MANRLNDPDPQFCDATGAPYNGGFLYFYASGSSTPLATYNDPDLDISHVNTNPVVLDSAGRAGAVFLQNLAYKVTLKDADLNTIWTMDPVSTSDFTAIAQFLTYAGDPNGNVAGTAGSADVPSSVIWDRTNNVLYVCTTTGTSTTAVWTAVNDSGTAITPPPQGRLTPTSTTAVISTDATSVTAIYYTPYVGNLLPVYNGASYTLLTFAELTLTLASQHAANTLYDVFGFSNSGTATLATGPAWTLNGTYYGGSGASLTAPGAASRGSGAGTTQLSRVLGLWTNAVSMTGRNGATTYAIGANQATYLGTIWIDASAGQVTCHVSFGQGRKFGVWNMYNRVPIILIAGDATASWTWNSSTFHAANATAANSATALQGLAEEWLDANYVDFLSGGVNGTQYKIGIGAGSVSTLSGVAGVLMPNNAAAFTNSTHAGHYSSPPFLGLQAFVAIEAVSTGTGTFTGTSASMELRAQWRG